MCGIVGFLAKRENHSRKLGEYVTPMLECMSTRGPDSAGLAVFREPLDDSLRRFGLRADHNGFDWELLHQQLNESTRGDTRIDCIDNHAFVISSLAVDEFKSWLRDAYPNVHLISIGRAIEMYKDEGLPRRSQGGSGSPNSRERTR